MGTLQRKIAKASGWTRVQNKNTEQTILARSGILQKITITGNGAVAVVTVSDGPASTIATSSVANPTVITTDASHNLSTGDSVVISGHTGSTPNINGTHIVTVTAPTTFTIDINVTIGGTGGDINIVNILEAPSDESKTFKFGINMLNDIRITPAAVTADITVIYDG